MSWFSDKINKTQTLSVTMETQPVHSPSIQKTNMCLPLHWFIVIASFWNPVTFLITYAIAVKYNHVGPWLPNISAIGSLPPESCWFSFFTNISTFLFMFSGYIRYAQVWEFSKCCPGKGPRTWSNIIATIIGLISTLGLFMLANWQVSNSYSINYIGANIAINGFIIYFILQTMFSYWMAQKNNLWLILTIRIILCMTAVTINIVRLVCNHLIHIHGTGGNIGKNTIWSFDEDGTVLDTVHSLTVWLLVFSFSIMGFTFYPEFRKIHLEQPVIKMKSAWGEPAAT